jgi:hypothetical protein
MKSSSDQKVDEASERRRQEADRRWDPFDAGQRSGGLRGARIDADRGFEPPNEI